MLTSPNFYAFYNNNIFNNSPSIIKILYIRWLYFVQLVLIMSYTFCSFTEKVSMLQYKHSQYQPQTKSKEAT